MTSPLRSTLTPVEAGVVIFICFGLFIFSSLSAVDAGFPDAPFTDASLWAMILVELLFAAGACAFLRTRQYDLASLWPEPSWRATAIGLGLFGTVWLLGAVVTWLVPAEAPQPIDKMVREATLSLPVILLMALVNSLFEETFLLGVLLRGLRAWGLSVALAVPLLVRVSYHLYQGPVGAVWVLVAGLLFSLCYVRFGKLWPVIVAHMLFDIVPFVFPDL